MNPFDQQAHQNQEFTRQATGLGHALTPENRQVVYGLPFPQQPQMVPMPIRGPIPIQGAPGLTPPGGLQPIPPSNFNNTMYFNLPTNFRGHFGPAGQLLYGPHPMMFGPGGPQGPMGPVGPFMVHPGQPSPTNSSVHSDYSGTESRNSSPGSNNVHKWNPNAKSFIPGQTWGKPDSDQTFRDQNEQDLSQNSDQINRGNMENNSRRKLEDAF